MIDSKYDIKIEDFGFVLGRHSRLQTHLYQRDEAPAFVNKFSSGDPNYRDATFFSTWVQLDWLNGFNQEFYDDPSKFYFSEGVNTTQLQQLTLERAFNSTGQTGDNRNVTQQAAWRTPASSWFGNGGDGALVISADTTDAPIDSTAAGTQGTNSLTATNANFTAGQKILIIQMMGTNAGSYQINSISNYSAGTITTTLPLNVTYATSGNNKAQVLVLKQYTDVTVQATKVWTAKAWDGTTGGILAFLASGTVSIAGTIQASEKGFRGGTGTNNQNQAYCGESSTAPSTAKYQANGSGGGGGVGNDSGGGGAGHSGAASNAGSYSGTGGYGGAAQGVANLSTMFMGAGGGGGSESNSSPASGGNGGNGGGIIMVMGATVTITGAVTSGGGTGTKSEPSGSNTESGGGGAGGSIMVKAQTATLGTNLITAPGGVALTASHGGTNGIAGRIHIDYYTSYTGSTTPTIDASQDSTLTSVSIGAGYSMLVGTDAGKIYSWDGNVTYTELFDVNRLEWYESGEDSDVVVGDTGGTETAQAQSFQLDEAMYVSGVEVYIKKAAGTPGDITVRIETDSSAKPSGTLANASLTATIPAFATTTYGWVRVNFPAAVQLAKTTVYHIVLKTAAADNDNNYNWRCDATSPAYTPGAMSVSTDGGTTWSAVATSDAYFRVMSESVGVTSAVLTDINAATTKLFWGTGNFSSAHVGGARIYSYDGTTWALHKIFTGTTESSIGAMVQFGSITPGVFIGLGHKAKVYFTADMTTYTVSKTITEPRNPGYVLTMVDYNGQLVVGGGYPEQLYGSSYQYSGFLYYYDEYQWGQIGTFEHTIITCLESFDTMLFVGTINKRLYVYNTATIDKLFEFPWDVQIADMQKWDDKLALAISTRPGGTSSGHEGVYIFDRNGLHNAFTVANRSWYSLFVFNNNLIAGADTGYVYTSIAANYLATGFVQTSYFEASLPSIDKLFKELTLQFESLPSGCSLTCYYKFKESDSWTALGAAITTAGLTQATLDFGEDIYAKKISVKIVLATSDVAVTPTIKKMLMKYQIAPDVKYIWKMTVVCPDNIKWGDSTVPVAKISTAYADGDDHIHLTSVEGFPNPAGSTYYASIIEADDTVHSFSYTGIDTDAKTLTGVATSGTYEPPVAAAGLTVKVLGRDIHRALLDLKRTKRFYTLTDVDGLTYTVYFSAYQTDNWVLDVGEGSYTEENEAPITLLEA